MDKNEELRMDLNSLDESQLEELARLIVRKLKKMMQQESERYGH